MIKYFHEGKKYEKISNIFQCNRHNTNIGRKPCKWLDVYFSGKEPNFSVKYRFEKECHFKNKFGVFLKTLIWQNVLLWRHCLLSCKANGKTKNVCPSSWCKPNLHNCSMPQSCWQNRQTGRLWWGNRKQKKYAVFYKNNIVIF